MGSRGARSNAKKDLAKFTQQGQKGGTIVPIDINKKGWANLTQWQLENKIREFDKEVLAVYDANGKLLRAYQGNENTVYYPASEMYGDYDITHNHPRGIAGFGGALSPADVTNATYGNRSITAVANGKGERSYTLRPSKNADGAGFRARISADEGALKNKAIDAYADTYKKMIKRGNSKENARLRARQALTGVYSSYWKNTAPQYGFEYTAYKKH